MISNNNNYNNKKTLKETLPGRISRWGGRTESILEDEQDQSTHTHKKME
jgi:hypothetical protein